jgi:hypothetical protein
MDGTRLLQSRASGQQGIAIRTGPVLNGQNTHFSLGLFSFSPHFSSDFYLKTVIS